MLRAGRMQVIFMVVFWITSGVSLVFADRLELVNGDVITGTIESVDGTRVIIRTDYGVLEIDRTAVRLGQFGIVESDVSDSLIFGFRFSGDLEDEAGAYKAVNNGMRFVADRDGLPSSALRSDGTGTYLVIAPTPELNALSEFTLFFWVRLEDLSSTQYLFSKWNAADGEKADGKIAVQTAGGNLTIYIVDPEGTYHRISGQGVLTAQDWHAVAFTFAAGRAALYVDGDLAATQRYSFVDLYEDAAPVLVMTAAASTGDTYAYYNAVGALDELRLYSRALSADEVALLSGKSDTE